MWIAVSMSVTKKIQDDRNQDGNKKTCEVETSVILGIDDDDQIHRKVTKNT